MTPGEQRRKALELLAPPPRSRAPSGPAAISSSRPFWADCTINKGGFEFPTGTASKRKGLWVGGMAPLGYETKGRKITVNEADAERVRTTFRSYLKLGSLNLLMGNRA